MDIVKTSDLVAADLPNLESPFFAASKVRERLKNALEFGASGLGRMLSLPPSFTARQEDHGRLLDEVEQKVRNGELWLVCGISDGPPFSPVLSWDDNVAGQGRWKINTREANFALGQSVQILNDNGITSQELSRRNGGGVGFLSASSLGTELISRRQETERQPVSVSPQSPFPAKQVEPLSPSVRATEATTPEKEPEIHLEIGLFTDGTLNNAENSQTYRDQIKEECLEPFERGEISQAECEYRLGLALGTSYTNTPSNVAKLAELYIETRKEKGDRVTHRLAEYAEGIGTVTGDGDSIEGMSTGLGDTGILSQVDKAFRSVRSGFTGLS